MGFTWLNPRSCPFSNLRLLSFNFLLPLLSLSADWRTTTRLKRFRCGTLSRAGSFRAVTSKSCRFSHGVPVSISPSGTSSWRALTNGRPSSRASSGTTRTGSARPSAYASNILGRTNAWRRSTASRSAPKSNSKIPCSVNSTRWPSCTGNVFKFCSQQWMIDFNRKK